MTVEMKDVPNSTEVPSIKTAPTQRRRRRVNRNELEVGAQSEINRKDQERSDTQSRERDEQGEDRNDSWIRRGNAPQ